MFQSGKAIFWLPATLILGILPWTSVNAAPATLRAGAAAIEITPTSFPRIVSGGFLAAKAERANDPLFARCLVLDDGTTRLAIVVVDTLMMPRSLIDEAKEQAWKATGIPRDRILVSATHTHSAPSVMGALGTPVDEDYAKRLPGWIGASIECAVKNLVPARIGWATMDAPQYTNCRRWIKRPDRIDLDPFGGRTVRAMMHPGYQNPDYIGPAGPKDPGLSLLVVQAKPDAASPSGRPIAALANYSMHYYGAKPVSADYFGRFCRTFGQRIHADKKEPAFVAIMSQGTAGDMHWMDYSQPARAPGLEAYADGLAQLAAEMYGKITYRDTITLAMAEKVIDLKRRVPDEGRLAWAKSIVEKMKNRLTPASIPEVYAREQFLLRDHPNCALKLQAIRIGSLGLTAIPCEVFAITGLKLKAQSPLEVTLNIELANGAEGYIPPPEQHALGGYTTWPARTAGLEIQAEPLIVEEILQLLEQVASKPRRKVSATGPYVEAVLASHPAAYWRLDDFAGRRAAEMTGRGNQAEYEEGVALYLEGPEAMGGAGSGRQSRAAHFAGGHLKAALAGLGKAWTTELWFWNGLPNEARPVTGYLFSRGIDGECLGIGGTPSHTGQLFFKTGDLPRETLTGTTTIKPKTWNHAVLVREGTRVALFLNGEARPEIAGQGHETSAGKSGQFFVGSKGDRLARFEGKIAEVAVYDRALPVHEIRRHWDASKEKDRP